MNRLTLLGIVLCFCVSCASTPREPVDANSGQDLPPANSARAIYSLGQEAIGKGDYRQALEHFTTVRRQFPEDASAPQALLGSGYAHYKLGDNDAAVETSNAFIQTYNNHSLVDYAYYLRGLARYGEGIAQLQGEQLTDNNHADAARKAFEYFAELVRRFPHSKYNQDARVRMEFLHSNLAEYELQLAKKALSLNKFREAIARSEYIIKNYARAEAAPEAYSVMIESFTAQGELVKASDVRKALARKFPDYRYTGSTRSSGTEVTRVDPDKLTRQQSKPISADSVTALPQPSNEEDLPSPHADGPAADNPLNLISPNTADPSSLSLTTNEQGIKREDWYLAQPGGSYTLQLLGTNDERALAAYIEQHDITDKAGYFVSQNGGKAWFTLTYGLYRTRNEALLAIKDLSPALQAPDPWVRPISDIQSKLGKR